jgi:hypothetical protein
MRYAIKTQQASIYHTQTQNKYCSLLNNTQMENRQMQEYYCITPIFCFLLPKFGLVLVNRCEV